MNWLWRRPASQECLQIVAVGAHMSGLPLNHQLVSLGASLVKSCRTAPVYRMYSLGNKPALVRTPEAGQGKAFEVEVWAVPIQNVGAFLRDGVKPPLCIGDVALEDGSQVKGFLCESYAVQTIKEISEFAGWRAYLASSAASPGVDAATYSS